MKVQRLAAGAAAMALLATMAPAAHADDYVAPVPQIGKLTKQVRGVGAATAQVQVTYQCQNDDRTTIYLLARVYQTSDNGVRQTFSVGWRNSPGYIRAAKCTGTWVTETLTLLPSNADAGWTLKRGRANLDVYIEPRGGVATPGHWYVTMGPVVSKSGWVQTVGPAQR